MTISNVKSKSELIAHLYRRAGFGATPSELENVSEMSYDDVVDKLMTFNNIDFEKTLISFLSIKKCTCK